MNEWKEFTGSDEQIIELLSTTKDKQFIVDSEWSVFRNPSSLNMEITKINIKWLRSMLLSAGVAKYLICRPHPYRDMLKRWADTGESVYWKRKLSGEVGTCNWLYQPFTCTDEYEYSFNPYTI